MMNVYILGLTSAPLKKKNRTDSVVVLSLERIVAFVLSSYDYIMYGIPIDIMFIRGWTDTLVYDTVDITTKSHKIQM
jgi:hypothetical protein